MADDVLLAHADCMRVAPDEIDGSDRSISCAIVGQKNDRHLNVQFQPEPFDKGIESITILPNGGVINQYSPGARNDLMAKRVQSSGASSYTSEQTYFPGRVDGLMSETEVSNDRNAISGTVTRRFEDGSIIEFDKRDGRLIRSRRFDNQGNLMPVEREGKEAAPPAAEVEDRIVVEASTGSAEHVKRVQEQVDKLPPAVRRALKEAGFRIYAPEKVVDVRPDLLRQTPRGYPSGSTFENSSAIHNFSRREIVIGDRYKSSSGSWYQDNRTEANLRHEVGHAIDAILGDRDGFLWLGRDPISAEADFKAAYDADVAKIPQADRSKLQYLLQNGNGGKSEAFAEVFAHVQGGASVADWATRSKIGTYFPDTEKFVRDKLNGL